MPANQTPHTPQVCDGLMGTAQGVLRGCGRQRQLMVYNIAGFWVCGVLLGYLLCFKAGLGVVGLWWGIASGDTVTGGWHSLLPTYYACDWSGRSVFVFCMQQNQFAVRGYCDTHHRGRTFFQLPQPLWHALQ